MNQQNQMNQQIVSKSGIMLNLGQYIHTKAGRGKTLVPDFLHPPSRDAILVSNTEHDKKTSAPTPIKENA